MESVDVDSLNRPKAPAPGTIINLDLPSMIPIITNRTPMTPTRASHPI